MTISKRLLTAILAVAAVVSVASAQDQSKQQGPAVGPGMMGPGTMGWGMQGMGAGMHGMMGQGMMGPGMMMGYGPMMEGRLAYLKAELGITDEQTEVWSGYVSAVKARTAAMQSAHATMAEAMRSGNAVERLQAHTQAMETIVESLKSLIPPTETLYKGLNDEQKKKADLLLGSGCCMM